MDTTPLSCTGETCTLDGEYWTHNDDGDPCLNVSIEINGLEDCEGCKLTFYEVDLNTNGALSGVGTIDIGEWESSGSVFTWFNSYFPTNPNPSLYHSSSNPSTTGKLGSGEIITFELLVGYVEDIEFCVRYVYECNEIQYSKECCGIVNLACS